MIDRTLFVSLVSCATMTMGCMGGADPTAHEVSALVQEPPAPVEEVRCLIDQNGDDRFDKYDLMQVTSMPASDCAAAAGVVMGGIPPRDDTAAIMADPPVVGLPTAPTPKEVLDWLDGTGIPKQPYEPSTHDCDDFAGEAEEVMEKLVPGGGTFTIYKCGWLNADGDFDTRFNPVEFHAITDLHIGGTTYWMEPDGNNNGGRSRDWDMDLDNDGKVNVQLEWGSGGRPSEVFSAEYGCLVVVYGSRKEAEADYGGLD